MPLSLRLLISSAPLHLPSFLFFIHHHRRHHAHPSQLLSSTSINHLYDSHVLTTQIHQNATKGRRREEARLQGTCFKGTCREEGGWKEDRSDWREEEAHQDAQGDILFIHLQRYECQPFKSRPDPNIGRVQTTRLSPSIVFAFHNNLNSRLLIQTITDITFSPQASSPRYRYLQPCHVHSELFRQR